MTFLILLLPSEPLKESTATMFFVCYHGHDRVEPSCLHVFGYREYCSFYSFTGARIVAKSYELSDVRDDILFTA